MSPFAAAALAYASAGLRVFPLRPRDKKPFGRTSGLKGASSDAALVAAWWAGRAPLALREDEQDRRPVHAGGLANIGIATGEASGVWVLDLDGPAAAEALAALELVHGPLPATPTQLTGKGRHMLFAWPEGREVRNSAGRIGPGIDVRGNGGYIVAAPSIHPSGRAYAWAEGLAFGEVSLAAAPAWLLDLAAPVATAAEQAPAASSRPRVQIEGRATRYGEAALTAACRDIASAPPGRQNDTLYDRSCSIGRLCVGTPPQIEREYARSALVEAGLSMQAGGKPWTRKQVEDMVDRALVWAEAHPLTPEPRRGATPAQDRQADAPSAGEAAIAIRGARELWASAERADASPQARAWFERFDIPISAIAGGLGRLRVHRLGPIGRPCLLGPLRLDPAADPDGLVVYDLGARTSRPVGFMGEAIGRALMLSEMVSRTPLLVALDLADACAVAKRAGVHCRVAVTPTLSAFAGGALGDAYGRISADTPRADPSRPPWTLPAPHTPATVRLVLRGDLRTAEFKFRRASGGTFRERLRGEEAARFLGSLAEQHWRAAMGAAGEATHAVRLFMPVGRSFSSTEGEA